MFKIKCSEAIRFNSHIFIKFLHEKSKEFPPKDTLRILNILQDISRQLEPYKKQYRTIAEKYGGIIDDSGKDIKYPSKEEEAKARKEQAELGKVEIEIRGDKLKIADSWPGISFLEMGVLSCIVDHDETFKYENNDGCFKSP